LKYGFFGTTYPLNMRVDAAGAEQLKRDFHHIPGKGGKERERLFPDKILTPSTCQLYANGTLLFPVGWKNCSAWHSRTFQEGHSRTSTFGGIGRFPTFGINGDWEASSAFFP